MNINRKINCNSEYMLTDLARNAGQIGMKPTELVAKFREQLEKRGMIDTAIRASKKMRREWALIGVGRYLKFE
jgi:hypothetical protein